LKYWCWDGEKDSKTRVQFARIRHSMTIFLRDSCNSTLFWHPKQWQSVVHAVSAWKHSQYFFRQADLRQLQPEDLPPKTDAAVGGAFGASGAFAIGFAPATWICWLAWSFILCWSSGRTKLSWLFSGHCSFFCALKADGFLSQIAFTASSRSGSNSGVFAQSVQKQPWQYVREEKQSQYSFRQRVFRHVQAVDFVDPLTERYHRIRQRQKENNE